MPPIEERKHALANLLSREHDGIALNRHYDGDGAVIYKHACALGCEGIVSKRLGSTYRSGRVNDWLKIKNLKASAVKREAKEDWGATRRVRQCGSAERMNQKLIAKLLELLSRPPQ